MPEFPGRSASPCLPASAGTLIRAALAPKAILAACRRKQIAIGTVLAGEAFRTGPGIVGNPPRHEGHFGSKVTGRPKYLLQSIYVRRFQLLGIHCHFPVLGQADADAGQGLAVPARRILQHLAVVIIEGSRSGLQNVQRIVVLLDKGLRLLAELLRTLALPGFCKQRVFPLGRQVISRLLQLTGIFLQLLICTF